MTEPDANAGAARQRMDDARSTARREAFRLARDTGAAIVTRPMLRGGMEPAVRDVEPLAGARAARDLELAARAAARDYIRQAREAGHSWEQISHTLGLDPAGPDLGAATAADAAFAYAAGCRSADPPWQPRHFGWTCRSCGQHIADRGLIGGPEDDEPGHAEGCARLAAAQAEWDAEAAQWDAEWEAGR